MPNQLWDQEHPALHLETLTKMLKRLIKGHETRLVLHCRSEEFMFEGLYSSVPLLLLTEIVNPKMNTYSQYLGLLMFFQSLWFPFIIWRISTIKVVHIFYLLKPYQLSFAQGTNRHLSDYSQRSFWIVSEDKNENQKWMKF